MGANRKMRCSNCTFIVLHIYLGIQHCVFMFKVCFQTSLSKAIPVAESPIVPIDPVATPVRSLCNKRSSGDLAGQDEGESRAKKPTPARTQEPLPEPTEPGNEPSAAGVAPGKPSVGGGGGGERPRTFMAGGMTRRQVRGSKKTCAHIYMHACMRHAYVI